MKKATWNSNRLLRFPKANLNVYIRAYHTDIAQFIAFLHENNVSIHTPAEVEKIDVMEHLSALAKRELTGIARARKMSAIREYFRFLEGVGVIAKSPTTGIETPKREKNGRQVLRSDEYIKMHIPSDLVVDESPHMVRATQALISR